MNPYQPYNPHSRDLNVVNSEVTFVHTDSLNDRTSSVGSKLSQDLNNKRRLREAGLLIDTEVGRAEETSHDIAQAIWPTIDENADKFRIQAGKDSQIGQEEQEDRLTRFYRSLGFPHVKKSGRQRAVSEPDHGPADFSRYAQPSTKQPQPINNNDDEQPPPPLSPSSTSSSLTSVNDAKSPMSSIDEHSAMTTAAQCTHKRPPPPSRRGRRTSQFIPANGVDYPPPPQIETTLQATSEFAPLPIRRSRTLPSKKTHQRKNSSWSPPMVTPSSWGEVPQSPAASFLSSFGASTSPTHDEEGDVYGDYTLGKVIGYGGFSTVREAYKKGTDASLPTKYAVKVVKRDVGMHNTKVVLSRLEHEINLWSLVDHPYIVKLEEVLETDYATFVICEYCDGGSLLDYVTEKGNPGLDKALARRIFLQICKAVRYLHTELHISHKDLKLENVLLVRRDDCQVKLCDFGMAEFQDLEKAARFIKAMSPQLHAIDSPEAPLLFLNDPVAGGSLAYAPPEQLRASHTIRDASADIWSLGVILYALLVGTLPFMDDFEPRMQQKILNASYDPPVNNSKEAMDVLQGCFQVDPTKRWTIQDILDSDWMRDATPVTPA
ncbi:hypothetical protein BZG36_00946 [Bifiguratus adelaidae]|uniref:Protein kinase domain-containing protein n=1 Tax=Bifiguratus adelaidae TaxID=1938954 RepID=A0A261Y5B0_9FUNG|nr:hypothetical protein BZG36_00946 [Bifiguratus adelaidae]